jgi:hypothetical protein
MKLLFSTLRAAFSQTIYRLWTMLLVNIITLVLAIPCAVVLAILPVVPRQPGMALVTVAALLMLLPSPTSAGMHVLIRDGTRGLPVQIGDYWLALRAHGPLALRAWIVAVVGTAIILANIEYYPRLHVVFTPFMEIIWLYILLVWLGIQLYLYPLIVEGDETGVFRLYRAAFVTVANNRAYTAAVTLLWLLLTILMSFSMLLVFLGLVFTAALQHNAARVALAQRQATTP